MGKDEAYMMRTESKLFDRGGRQIRAVWVPEPAQAAAAPAVRSAVDGALVSATYGSVALQMVLATIAGAREVVVVVTFVFNHEEVRKAMLEAAERGVRVYLLLPSMRHLEREIPEEDASQHSRWQRQVRDSYEQLHRDLGGRVLVRSADHFHTKAVIADPLSDTPRGVLLTANIATDAFEHPELVVELTSEEARHAGMLMRYAMWAEATNELLTSKVLATAVRVLKMGETEPKSGPLLMTLGATRSIREYVLGLVRSAPGPLYVASYGWEHDHDVVKALAARSHAKTHVTVLARPLARPTPALVELCRAGARVLGVEGLHAKSVWSAAGAVVMSANLERKGLDEGFELGVALDGRRAEELGQVLRGWAGGSSGSLSRLLVGATVRELPTGATVRVPEGSRMVKTKVEPRRAVQLKPIQVQSLDQPLPPMVEPEVRSGEYERELELRREVHEPVLAPGAEREATPARSPLHRGNVAAGGGVRPTGVISGPVVYREPGGRRVVAVSSREQVPEGARLKLSVGAAAVVFDRRKADAAK